MQRGHAPWGHRGHRTPGVRLGVSAQKEQQALKVHCHTQGREM